MPRRRLADKPVPAPIAIWLKSISRPRVRTDGRPGRCDGPGFDDLIGMAVALVLASDQVELEPARRSFRWNLRLEDGYTRCTRRRCIVEPNAHADDIWKPGEHGE